MSIINPFEEFGVLNFLYYLTILSLGPCTALYLILFRSKRNRLLAAYRESGVEVLGLVTHRQITVKRGAVTGIEKSRTHKIRYAYRPPESDELYIKDFVTVRKEDLNRRLVLVTVLPGQPESGVPKFLLPKTGCLESPASLSVCSILSGLMVFYCTVVFALLIAFEVEYGTHCQEIKTSSSSYYNQNQAREYVCVTTLADYGWGLLAVLALGAGGALYVYSTLQATIPGRVWHRARCSRSSTVTPSWHRYETMDNRAEIPVAEAVVLLASEEATSAAVAAIRLEHAEDPSVPIPMAQATPTSSECPVPETDAKVVQLIHTPTTGATPTATNKSEFYIV